MHFSIAKFEILLEIGFTEEIETILELIKDIWGSNYIWGN